ncbi:MAG: pyruvate, phosphate dikinase [Deltaproteobacteria bacterium]|nr:MAG: pyruvate, phosphate dikinase [Deltaproteobacteria bacterium]
MAKYVYFFGEGKADGTKEMKGLLGGKGANLAEMTNLGIPVPPGFTISTDVCAFYKDPQRYPTEIQGEVDEALARMESALDLKFGDPEKPLLMSVRSGAAISMPGMMDTVLNLGLNDETVAGLIEQSGNPRFVYDSYRRLISMYGDVVMGLKPESRDDIDPFEEILEDLKKEAGVELDLELSADDLKELTVRYKEAIKSKLGTEFPQDPREQLWGGIGAVFYSWDIPRAVAYRELNDIPDDMGTAVNVQAMVFGNLGEDSGTGVAFTRNPASGENTFYGEYLMNAQGEDVVAGIRTPQPINKLQKGDRDVLSLEEERPDIYEELDGIRKQLDTHYREMQDIEFTIQKGKLWMLQTRSGKRTGVASVRIAVEMVEEGLISKEEAIMRVEPDQLNQLLQPTFNPAEKNKSIDAGKLLAVGLNAGPGAATGRVVFNAEDAVEWAGRGERVILVRWETSPDDIRGMDAAQGILTARGGMTSHAALVARQMGKVCVAGCGALDISYKDRQMAVDGKQIIKEGDWISLDGSVGQVLIGEIPTYPSEVYRAVIECTLDPMDSAICQAFGRLLTWADEVRRLGIRTNADEPEQCEVANAFGAEGIGLTRTEHMFFMEDRITSMREMILADTKEDRKKALAKLLPMQREDFLGIFRVMDGKPVTIRTLDPPLHEFLPHDEAGIADLANSLSIPVEEVEARVESLAEANPMLGHRGCRLGIVYPEITAMQARAILEAACVAAKEGVKVVPEIMIPLISGVEELKNQKEVVLKEAEAVFSEQGMEVEFSVGTMIEIPRAALTADAIAAEAEFFSYGTNDLTQTVYGISRDDSAKFLYPYIEGDIWPDDPFDKLDQTGVGQLVDMGVRLGRSTRPDLKVGICGEHGGEPSSIDFCHRVGLDYVSCSPFRVPIARLAAAQAALRNG